MRCEEIVGLPDMEAFFDAAGEFYDYYTGEIMDRDATIVGIRDEFTQMQEFEVFEWKRKSEKPSNEKVISTKMFHKERETRSGQELSRGSTLTECLHLSTTWDATHVGTEDGDHQNDVEGSYTAACVTRCQFHTSTEACG